MVTHPENQVAAGGLQTLPREPHPSRLLLIADTSRDALQRRVAEVRGAIGETAAWMLAERFGDGPHRVAIVGANREQLLAGLTTADEQLAKSDRLRRARGSVYFGEASAPPGPMVFLFPGQGSQHEGMLAELCVAFPTLRRWFEDLERAVADVEPSVLSMIYGTSSTPERLFGLGGGAQIAFIAGIALHEILTSLGLKADAMLGHSSGEHAALVTSGTFSHPDRNTIFAAAHDVMLQARDLPKPLVAESSVAVSGCPRELLMQLIGEMPGRLFLAMDNCPSQSVLAGTADAIENATARIHARGAICVPLAFEHAYHTPLFDAWRRRLEEIYRSAIPGREHTPLYSCATAGPYPEDAESARALAAAQWSSVVRFGDTIERLYADGYRTFLEVGPGNKLTGFVDDVLRKRPHVAVSACSSSRPDLEQLHHMAAELFVNGYAIDAARFTLAAPQTPSIVEHHFALMQEFVATQERVFAMFENAMGNRPSPREIARTFTLESDPILRDHSLGQCLPVIPFTMSLELAMEATGANEITDVSAYRWLALDQGSLSTSMTIDGDHIRIFEVQGEKKHLAFECKTTSSPLPAARGEGGRRPGEGRSAQAFYDNYAFHGPRFQCIKEILHVGATSIEARLERTQGEATLLDTAGQLVALTLLEQGRKNFGIFPFRLKRLARWRNEAKTIYANATVQWNDRGTTNADIVYTDEQGNVVYDIEGFEQRYLEIPPKFAQLIFGTKPKPQVTLKKEDIPTDFLEESWHIWARALAHRFLDRDELRAWYALPDRRQAIESLRQRITEDAWQPAAMTSGERSSTS